MARRYSQAEIRAMFVFAPLPRSTYKLFSLKVRGSGLFRLFVNEQGKVTSVSVLKSIGHPQIDVAMAKTFSSWRARPGPKREVDIPVDFGPPS
jgi:TonB family protein